MAYRSDARTDPAVARKRLEEAQARAASAEERCRAAQEHAEQARSELSEQERALTREVTLAEMARGRAVRRRLATQMPGAGSSEERAARNRFEEQVRQSLRTEAVLGALEGARTAAPAPTLLAIPERDLEAATHLLQQARRKRAVHAAQAHEALAPLDQALAQAEAELHEALAELEAAEANLP